MKLPRNVKQLNTWIYAHFQVLEGPTRAFIELPFYVEAMGRRLNIMHRIAFVRLALHGPEELCCAQIAQALCDAVPLEELQDTNALLFLRSAFERHEDFVQGRLAFFDNAYMNKLVTNRCYVREGCLALPVLEIDPCA